MRNAECADLIVALCFHVLREYGADAAIFAAGPMLKRAILAAETLEVGSILCAPGVGTTAWFQPISAQGTARPTVAVLCVVVLPDAPR